MSLGRYQINLIDANFHLPKVWKCLIKNQATKSDPKLTRGGKCPSSCQSHYRKVPRQGVSNRTRNNWKCLLAYKKIQTPFQNNLKFFNTSKCSPNYVFHLRYMIFSYVKLWRQENWPFGPNPAQIQPKSQFLFSEKSPTTMMT